MAKKTTAKSKPAGGAASSKPGKKPSKPPVEATSGNSGSTAGEQKVRVRMYRVGFGDFFLLTVPARGGGACHILIDCGVHAGDIGSMKDAVTQMAKDCDSHLSIVIMTHRHADHISGFGTCSDIFKTIQVDHVWMPWFEDPKDQTAKNFQASLTALASKLTLRLAARQDDKSVESARMADNIVGSMNALAGAASNQKSLDVLNGGFKNKTTPDYYRAGDEAKLPQALIDAGLTAQILGPPGDRSLIPQMTNKSQQYLAATGELDDENPKPFPPAFNVDPSAYPADAFKFIPDDQIVRLVNSIQPEALAALAKAADNTLNNQSLVILFSFDGKNMLFAGDAQWGNWQNFLYGGRFGTPGHTELTKEAKDILGKIDFYKVGHHGSANATPKDAVAAMRRGCAGMCSTQIDCYNEVPREPLLKALSDRMEGKLARSDQIPAAQEKANPEAGLLNEVFRKPTGSLFIDYEF